MKNIIAFLLLFSAIQAGEDTLCIKVVYKVCDQYSCRLESQRGSATVINKSKAGYWCAATAKHVVQTPTESQVYFGRHDGTWGKVKGVYKLDEVDAAFITFLYDGDLEIAKTRHHELKPQTRITFVGFSEGTTPKKFRGIVKHSGWAVTDNMPIEGQSGGGVYHDNCVVGIVSAKSTGVGYGPNGEVYYPPPGEENNLSFVPYSQVKPLCEKKWGFWWGDQAD